MAPNKMLIDATHPEETRVVVLRNGRVEEFDYESAARKLLRGNIYLAKVTRVEPSLQAAFVDYGGNRHGFLAFNEIHPDYYQIPMADRQALLDEEAAAEAEEEAAADARAERLARRRRPDNTSRGSAPDSDDSAHADDHAHDHHDHGAEGEGSDDEHADDDAADDDRGPQVIAEASVRDDVIVEDAPEPESAGGFEGGDEPAHEGDDEGEGSTVEASAEAADAAPSEEQASSETREGEGVQVVASASAEPEALESTGAEDALEELPSRPRRRPRSYKIQEVIKRRQVILVQVVKEERGNKGAALTTYLSLAGRYTVLMPNTARGGGISRKITNPQDRKRLKAIAQELEVPEGMGLIIRTAGAARTKQEIKRDFEYLLRLWESVRDLTLESTAPSLVYEEGNLIKRSIRDLYNKDVEEIIVAGEHAHKDAKDFMRMLMPSHAKNVIPHQDPEPLFTKYGIERQLNAMFNPYVTLKSGGYLVINQTEALVAIDVNSGKSTREFSIEETALNTNLEASDEIARQVKLRDLAGLIVIDFIDMEEKRNNRAVERRLKDALRFDRARIQLGRISHFGLMEMSRQRLRSGVLEGSTSQCPHCQGTGIIRSTESVALAVLRAIEDAMLAGARSSLIATTTSSVALYILNNKRHFINEMETRNGIFVTVQASDKLQGANFLIEKGHAAPVATRRPDRAAVNMDWGFAGEGVEGDASDAGDDEDEVVESQGSGEQRGEPRARDEGRGEGGRRRRRRRGRRGGEGGRGEGRGDGRRNEELGAQSYDDDNVETVEERDEPIEAVGGDQSVEADDGYGDDEGAPREAREPGSRGGERSEDGNGRRRRRGRRGGRRGRERRPSEEGTALSDAQPDTEASGFDDGAGIGDVGSDDAAPVEAIATNDDAAPSAAPAREPRRSRSAERNGEERTRSAKPVEAIGEQSAIKVESPAPVAPEKHAQAPERADAPEDTVLARVRARQATLAEPKLERVVVSPEQSGETGEGGGDQPTRRGWWQRRLGG
ncbi:ribonuclease E/G [Hyphomicrobium sp. LHD-15]|uniref:Rne/Rng family ribonuclease n=1 Tax=Hyphomicrobium sp. LHD-15 TaxID=3072142 RepID=UPI0028107282|nr:ribonuclease E/G [Hyphomicrobium sp. LHD-15]MDQ8699294.1 ribonuclease E/G [Hyphomicrobium sp. LHD-15]